MSNSLEALSLVFHMTHGYILLTANLDDLHDIVKELADSPMSDQIGSILRRAYNQFGVMQGQKPEYKRQPGLQMRAQDGRKMDNGSEAEQGSGDGPGDVVETKPSAADTRDDKLEYNRRKMEAVDFPDEKNEKYYIKSINKVLDTV